jgi:alpha-beta hydrolase superfamily lysophospholipase
LLISLRAHGDSTGDYNDFGYGARHDVIAAVDYLERRRPGRPVVILGASLGSAAALFASAELGSRVRGYILESPYKDLRTAVWNRLDDALPPVLDWVAYRGLVAVSTQVVPHLDQISPYHAAGAIPADVPVLILAGSADRRARLHEARAILGRVSERSELVIFPGADHMRMMEVDPARYRDAVLGFVEKARVGFSGL